MGRKIHVAKEAVYSNVASVQKYQQEIKRFDPLSKQEEKEIIKKAQEGDETSKNKIVRHNLRFVVQVAKKYQGLGLPIEDLIAFGNVGLVKSVELFDIDKDVKFISYAVWHIRSEIQCAINDLGHTVRVPSHWDQEDKFDLVSIHKPTSDSDESESYADRYLAGQESERKDYDDLRHDLFRCLSVLTDREKLALTMHYGIDEEYEFAFDQIAERLDLTGERVRQLVRGAEKKLLKAGTILKKYR